MVSSSGTMLYPLIAGNGRKDFGLFEPITKAQEAWFFVVSVVNTTALPGTIPALVGAWLLSTTICARAPCTHRRRRR